MYRLKVVHLIYLTAISKQKKIRFIDDASRNPDEEEKDTRLKFARPKQAGVTPLQAKMLKLAGQQAPEKKEVSAMVNYKH